MNIDETLISNPNGLEKHHSSVNYVCSFCDAVFDQMNYLELHCRLHDKNKNFKCLVCNAMFADLQKLKLHDLQHSMEEAHEDLANIDHLMLPFSCSACTVCGENFSCDEELVDHSVKHQEVSVKTVSTEISKELQSDQYFPNAFDSTCEDDSPINYPILRQKIIMARNGDICVHFTLSDHMKNQYEEFTRIIKNEANSRKVLINRKKTTVSDFKAKKKNVSNPTKRPKKIAPKKISLKSARKTKSYSSDSEVQIVGEVKDSDIEEISVSRQSKVKALKKKIWKDRQNPHLFRRVPLIAKSKIITNKKKKLLTCPVCKKTYTSFSLYEKHRSSHKKAFCSKCSRTFSNISQLKRHNTMYHSDGKEHICTICSSPFATQSLLNVHKKMHNANEVHTCNTCNRKFYHFAHFNKHNCSFLPHAVCKVCQYAFTRKTHLKKHLLTAHNLQKKEALSLLAEYIVDKKIDMSIKNRNKDGTLSSHVRPKSKSRITLKKDRLKDSKKPKKKIQKKEYCKICKILILKKNFIRHLTNIHKLKKDEIELLRNDFVRFGKEKTSESMTEENKLIKKDSSEESKPRPIDGHENLVEMVHGMNENPLSENTDAANDKKFKIDLECSDQHSSKKNRNEESLVEKIGEKTSYESSIQKSNSSDRTNSLKELKVTSNDKQERESSIIGENEVKENNSLEYIERKNKKSINDLNGSYQQGSVEKNGENDEKNMLVEKNDQEEENTMKTEYKQADECSAKKDNDQEEESNMEKEYNQEDKCSTKKDNDQDENNSYLPEESLVEESNLSKITKLKNRKNDIKLRSSNRRTVPEKNTKPNPVLEARATRKSTSSASSRTMPLRSKISSFNTMKSETKKVPNTIKKTTSGTRQVLATKSNPKNVVNGKSSKTIKKATELLNKKATNTKVRAVAVLAKSEGSLKKTASTKSLLIKKSKTSLRNSNSVRKVSQKNNSPSLLVKKSNTNKSKKK